MNINPQPETRKKMGWKVKTAFIVVFFIIFVVILGNLLPPASNTNTPKSTVPAEKFTKVTSYTGSQSGKSPEFTVGSKNVKFVSRCNSGIYVCTGWLTQVGGSKQELFHSSGNTGTLTEDKVLAVGPGTFYIEMDTRDRAYSVDVFQGTPITNTTVINAAQQVVDTSSKYRTVTGFNLTSQNDYSGYQTYTYHSTSGQYTIQLTVDPKVTDFELESNYTLAKRNVKVGSITVQYAFNKGSTINGVQIDKPYQDAEFTFVASDKTHVGFVRGTTPDIANKADRGVIESTLKSFVNALVPNI